MALFATFKQDIGHHKKGKKYPVVHSNSSCYFIGIMPCGGGGTYMPNANPGTSIANNMGGTTTKTTSSATQTSTAYPTSAEGTVFNISGS